MHKSVLCSLALRTDEDNAHEVQRGRAAWSQGGRGQARQWMRPGMGSGWSHCSGTQSGQGGHAGRAAGAGVVGVEHRLHGKVGVPVHDLEERHVQVDILRP